MNCVTPVQASTDPVDVPRQMCRVSSYETPSHPALAQSVAESPASFTWRRSLGIPVDVALVIPQPINTKNYILNYIGTQQIHVIHVLVSFRGGSWEFLEWYAGCPWHGIL